MKRIIVCLDGSELSQKALDRGLEEALAGRASLLAVTVVEGLSFLAAEDKDCTNAHEALLREPRRILAEAKKIAAERGLELEARWLPGRPAETVARLARDEKADEIILGSLGKDAVHSMLLGSMTTRLVQLAPCSIVVVR